MSYVDPTVGFVIGKLYRSPHDRAVAFFPVDYTTGIQFDVPANTWVMITRKCDHDKRMGCEYVEVVCPMGIGKRWIYYDDWIAAR